MTQNNTCDRCGNPSLRFHRVEDDSMSMQYEKILGVPYPPDVEYICDQCAGVQTPAISLPTSVPVANPRSSFNVNLFQGKVAQVIVETIFLEFGFEVFPFGYESYFTSIIRSLSGYGSNSSTSLKIRSMPDLMIFEPSTKRVF